MKWFLLIYNILDFIHDKILHPIFKDEPEDNSGLSKNKPTKKPRRRNVRKNEF